MPGIESPNASSPLGAVHSEHGSDVRRLGACLKVLIAQYDLAEAEYEQVSKRCYTSEFKAILASTQLTEEMRSMLADQREEETGFSRAVEERPELAYAQVLALIDEILDLDSMSPAALSLKATACLWERPADELEGDGGKRAAAVLTRLAALQ